MKRKTKLYCRVLIFLFATNIVQDNFKCCTFMKTLYFPLVIYLFISLQFCYLWHVSISSFLHLDMDPPVILVKNTTLIDGSLLTMSCSVNSNPTNIQYTWTKDGNVIGNTTHLTIPDVSTLNSGEYKCLTKNIFAEKVASVKITVYSKFIFVWL